MVQDANDSYMIEGAGVTKVFKDFWGRPKITAVDNVSLRVAPGAVFGLLGPNGAGKSTLIKMLLGHLYPTAGRLQVLGRDPTDVEAKSRLGYLPERAHLYKNLTAEETLRFFGQILELPPPEIRSRMDQLLAMVGLEQARRRLVGEFSHGMMRRMGLAQALLNDPDLLLLDEPTAGLDPIGCHEVKSLIMTLARRGKTILLTSHLLADVEDVCDEIMVLYGGKVLASGLAADLLREQEILQIRLPALAEDSMRRLHAAISLEAPPDQVELSSPTRSLESYFLEVVREASGKAETHGARVGAGVANFLRQGVSEPDEVLAALAHARPAANDAPAPAPEVEADEVLLDELSDAREGNAAPPQDAGDDAPDIDEDLLDELSGRD